MKTGIFLLLAAVVVFTGCQSSQAAPKHDQKPNLDGCVKEVREWNITLKQEITSFMGVSKERMPALFCQRLAAGLRSGRISYSDVNNLQLNLPTEIWLVIKGKSKPTPQTPAPSSLPRASPRKPRRRRHPGSVPATVLTAGPSRFPRRRNAR